MPRPEIDTYYLTKIETYAEEGMSAAAITRLLSELARKAERKDAPADRTVRRYLEKHLAKPVAERRQAALFRWPQSMLAAALPWEAGPAALELLRYRDERLVERPTIRLVRWYWRLMVIAPDLPVNQKSPFAAQLATWEWLHDHGRDEEVTNSESIEWMLAYHPWRSEADQEAFGRNIERHRDAPVNGATFTSEAASKEFLTALWGPDVADYIFQHAWDEPQALVDKESEGEQHNE